MSEGTLELDRKPGRVEVSSAAITAAVCRVVLECYGVVGIADRKLKHGKAELLDDRHYPRGIGVSLHGERVVIDIFVVVEYGTRISEVAHNIMGRVWDTLKRMLRSDSITVNVHVHGLRISG